MSEQKFKVGDKVEVLGQVTNQIWVEEMHETIGETFEISDVSPEDTVLPYAIYHRGSQYWFAEANLELIESAQKPTAITILEKSVKHMKDRAETYDSPEGERSMGNAIAMFNAAKGYEVLSESDGWLLLTLLKIVRDQTRKEPHLDSLEDGPAYLALYGESRLNSVKENGK